MLQSTDAPTELPPKTDVVLWLSLTPAQLELYNDYLKSDLVRRAASQKCGMEALRAIALLKKLCNHPLLCLPTDEFNDWRYQTITSRTATAQQRVPPQPQPRPVPGDLDGAAAEEEVVGQALPKLRGLVPNSAETAALLSCKLRVLSVLLPPLQRRGHRALIFSQSTRMLDLIQNCVLRVMGLKFLRVDGTIDPKDRDLKLAKFQAPESKYFCMCLSSQVGGVGLTITGADRVILVDPAWNPAMDSQAIDRVHRIGQQREVVVYRLIGAGAIEDKMFRLQVFKRGLAKTALEHEQQLRFFTHKQLKTLFEAPSQAASTQSLMAEQLGTEALEHEELLRVVSGDVGATNDPQAIGFWTSSDVIGFSDYEKLFQYLETSQQSEVDVEEKARAISEKLRSEEYVKDQVVAGRYKAPWKDSSEGMSPQGHAGSSAELPVLQAE